MHSITVEGRPVPKARPRLRPNGRTYTPAKTVAAEQRIAWEWRITRGPKYEGQVEMGITFWLPDHRRVDIDNLAKTVLDGLNNVAYKDDSQIYQLSARKVCGGVARTTICVSKAVTLPAQLAPTASSLSPGGAELLVRMKDYMSRNGVVSIPATELAHELGHSTSWVYSRLRELEGAGALEQTQSPDRRGNAWRILGEAGTWLP